MYQRRTPSTAKFAVAQLRRLDWIQRHEYFEKIGKFNPILMHNVQLAMSPDELMTGLSTGLKALPGDVIVMKDRARKKHHMVQATLDMYFHVKKRRVYQATLDMFFC